MREVCPEEDPASAACRDVRPFIVDRKQIWPHIDDVEWAVKYLFVQHELKGVSVISADDAGPVCGEIPPINGELPHASSSGIGLCDGTVDAGI